AINKDCGVGRRTRAMRAGLLLGILLRFERAIALRIRGRLLTGIIRLLLRHRERNAGEQHKAGKADGFEHDTLLGRSRSRITPCWNLLFHSHLLLLPQRRYDGGMIGKPLRLLSLYVLLALSACAGGNSSADLAPAAAPGPQQ